MRRVLALNPLHSHRTCSSQRRSWRRVLRRRRAPTSPTRSSTTTRCNGAISRSFSISSSRIITLSSEDVSTGRMLSIKIEAPAYHTTEDGRWDYRVTIRYKNSTAATTANPDEEALSSSFGPIRTPTRRKSSGASRFSLRTGICRSRILRRRNSE